MKVLSEQKAGTMHNAGSIDMIYYTDPLCCWSYAMRQSLKKLRTDLGPALRIRYCMGGLIPSWDNFFDPLNSVKRPAQMGPVWMHAAHIAGVDINSGIWVKDPPASSFPACIAFKCVELQSPVYAVEFFDLLQDAVMSHGINIAKTHELLGLAAALKRSHPAFDNELFERDLLGVRGLEAFRSDLQEIPAMRIERFPAMIVRRQGRSALRITGYRDDETLLQIIRQ